MTWPFVRSLRFKAAVGVALPVFVALAAISTLQYWRERRALYGQMETMAVHLGQVMQGSLRHAMLTRDRDGLLQTLTAIGQLDSVLRVAIFDSEGRLSAADNPAEFSPAPDRSSPGCVECHRPGDDPVQHSLALTLPGGERLLRSSILIPNEPACYDCHGSAQPYLGVLIADLSLQELEQTAAANLRLGLGLSVLVTVLITAGVYGQVHLLVVRRVERFRRPLSLFSHGDFAPRIPLARGEADELGDLAGAVNQMAERLSQQGELERRARLARQEAIIEERGRLARELHDSVAQVLSYFNVKAMAVRMLLGRGQNVEAGEQLQELEQASRRLCQDIRLAIHDLKANPTGEGSFAEALGECVELFHQQTGLPVALQLVGDGQGLALTAEAELQLLRIAQEALANVYKHAGAGQAWVHLKTNGGREADLIIGDDGQGFDSGWAGRGGNNHFGLITMRERAETIGGTLAIHSISGAGTEVRVRFPLAAGKEGSLSDDAHPGS